MGEEESSAQLSTPEVVQSANAVTKNEVAAGSATQTAVRQVRPDMTASDALAAVNLMQRT